MATLDLIRWSYGPDQTLGLLKFPMTEAGAAEYALWTVECPWQNNTPFMSAIPDGSYNLQAFDSPDHPGCWVITPVEGRNGILIHTGNKVADVTGCICVGITRSDMCVWESADAMRLLNFVLSRNETHTIHIGPGLGAVMPQGEPDASSTGIPDLDNPPVS